mmetsp:Transcript_128571/g.400106  ORF Transcript_128571/g.400106 Transcript_128571/m.400106 type:complete len:251 (-) Transcript_128571:61-813(-)
MCIPPFPSLVRYARACEGSLPELACPSSRHGLQHLAGLRVELGLDEPAVLVSEDVVLACPQVRSHCVRAVLAQVVGTQIRSCTSLDGAVWLDRGLVAEGIGDDAAGLLQHLLGGLVGLDVRPNREGRVVQAVDLVEVVQALVALHLSSDPLHHNVQRRKQPGGGRNVWVGLRLDQLLAKLGGAARRRHVQGGHAIIVLVVDVGLLLQHTVEPPSALAKTADGHQLHIRGHLLSGLEAHISLLCHHNRHGF